jgi:hypothetical protein
MTFSALLYAEGFTDFLYGLSFSYQLFNGILYLDYLYKPYNDMNRAFSNSPVPDSFPNNSALLLGLRYSFASGILLSFEYLYNGNGFSTVELDDFILSGNASFSTGYFNANNWAKHNMHLSLMWNPSFLSSMTVGCQLQLLAPAFTASEYMGLMVSPYFGYSFSQYLSVGLSMRFPVGGAMGYFELAERKQVEAALEVKFKY